CLHRGDFSSLPVPKQEVRGNPSKVSCHQNQCPHRLIPLYSSSGDNPTFGVFFYFCQGRTDNSWGPGQ
ncbi:unnamed protein product, partial [Staurois parvus]